MKVGVFYDMLVSRGGAEKAAIDLATALNADLITSGYNRTIPEFQNLKIRIINIGNSTYRLNKTIGYLLEVPVRFFFTKHRFDYDVYVFSGASSIFGSVQGKRNIWYCHSPNRGLYDQFEKHRATMKLFPRLILLIYVTVFRIFDQRIVKKNIIKIVSNSKNAAARVKKYYDRTSETIYPCIDTNQYKFNRLGNFYLAVSRLFPAKRMTLIARTFNKMPDKKLILVGDGPQKTEIEKIIQNNSNISLFTNTDDEQLKKLYADCKAVIYIPEDEDFGLVPVEAMSSGKVAIVSDEGGCKETVNNPYLRIIPTERNLINKINTLSDSTLLNYKKQLREQSKKFDTAIFRKQWLSILNNYV